MQLRQQGTSPCLSMLSSNVRRLPADFGFDRVQRLDTPQRLRSKAAVVASVLDVEVPPWSARVRPAGSFGDPAAVVDAAPAAIGVRLQDAAEAREVAARMFALAIGRVAIPG